MYVENDIYPYEGINTGEDLNVLLRVFHYGKKLAYIDKAYYHYVMRGSSLTHNRDAMALWDNNISKNLKHIIDFFVFLNEQRGNSCFDSLLNLFNLQDRVVSSVNPEKSSISWKEVIDLLDSERHRCQEWLTVALN